MYAGSLGLRTIPLDELAQKDNAVFIVDNRISARECSFLEEIIKGRDIPIILKIVDPVYLTANNHPYDGLIQ